MAHESPQPPEQPHPDEPREGNEVPEEVDPPSKDIEDPAEGGDEAPTG